MKLPVLSYKFYIIVYGRLPWGQIIMFINYMLGAKCYWHLGGSRSHRNREKRGHRSVPMWCVHRAWPFLLQGNYGWFFWSHKAFHSTISVKFVHIFSLKHFSIIIRFAHGMNSLRLDDLCLQKCQSSGICLCLCGTPEDTCTQLKANLSPSLSGLR